MFFYRGDRISRIVWVGNSPQDWFDWKDGDPLVFECAEFVSTWIHWGSFILQLRHQAPRVVILLFRPNSALAGCVGGNSRRSGGASVHIGETKRRVT